MREEIRERGKRGEERKRLNGGRGSSYDDLRDALLFGRGRKRLTRLLCRGNMGERGGGGEFQIGRRLNGSLGGRGIRMCSSLRRKVNPHSCRALIRKGSFLSKYR